MSVLTAMQYMTAVININEFIINRKKIDWKDRTKIFINYFTFGNTFIMNIS